MGAMKHATKRAAHGPRRLRARPRRVVLRRLVPCSRIALRPALRRLVPCSRIARRHALRPGLGPLTSVCLGLLALFGPAGSSAGAEGRVRDARRLALVEYAYAACLEAYYEAETDPPPRGRETARRWKERQRTELGTGGGALTSYALARMEVLGGARARAHPEAYPARGCRAFARDAFLRSEVDAVLDWHEVTEAATPDVASGPPLVLEDGARAGEIASELVSWRVAAGRLGTAGPCGPGPVDYLALGERALAHARKNGDLATVEGVLYLAARLRAEGSGLDVTAAGWRLVDRVLTRAEKRDTPALRRMLAAYRPRHPEVLRALASHAACLVQAEATPEAADEAALGSDEAARRRATWVSRIEGSLALWSSEADVADRDGAIAELWREDPGATLVRQIFATDARLDAHLKRAP